MPLRTFSVPWQVGRVRTVRTHQDGLSVTVECPDPRWAFTFVYMGKLEIESGDWVHFRGTVRIEVGKSGPTNLVYAHDPFDGSNRFEWIFFKMEPIPSPDSDFVTGVEVTPSPEIAMKLRNAHVALRRLLQSWKHNGNEADLISTAHLLREAEEILLVRYEELRKRRQELDAPIRAIDVTL